MKNAESKSLSRHHIWCRLKAEILSECFRKGWLAKLKEWLRTPGLRTPGLGTPELRTPELRTPELVTLLVSLVLLCLLQSCGGSKQTGDKEPANGEASENVVNQVVVAPVTSAFLHRTLSLPAELHPFRDVKVHSKIKGFVSWIGVDRGSRVKKGEMLLKLSAPELDAECEELKAKITAARAAHAEAISTMEADRASYVEMKAKLEADILTCQRLKKAAHEPGAIAQNEIDTADKTVEGDEARLKAAQSKVAAAESVVKAKKEAVRAAENSLKALEETKEYLTIRAPLDGVITERWVHEGDIAGVEQGRDENARPLLRLAQVKKLRLIVSVPEMETAGIKEGNKLSFTVPAYPGKEFTGTVCRVGHALDVHTRTMPVELDVDNERLELEPGMYATVKWVVDRPYATLFVPSSAVVSTLERTFVVRVKAVGGGETDSLNGLTELVDVRTGETMAEKTGTEKVEVIGNLKAGDDVVVKASDEYKDGTRIVARLASAADLEEAARKGTKTGGE